MVQALRKGSCLETIAPAQAGTGTGADFSSKSLAALDNPYLTGTNPATAFDPGSDALHAVTAYVSRSTVYVVDAELRVIAFGKLTRRGC